MKVWGMGAAAGLSALGLLLAGSAATTASAATEARSLTRANLVTVQQVKAADWTRDWSVQVDKGKLPAAYCGPTSTEGKAVAQRMARGFTNEMMSYGTQYLTRYQSNAAAKAAYTRILATLKTCTYSKPSPTHARRITENRTIKVGDATTILRWWDYALPSDPGSENGAFPYAVTRNGNVVSVLAFSQSGVGMTANSINAIAVQASENVAGPMS